MAMEMVGSGEIGTNPKVEKNDISYLPMIIAMKGDAYTGKTICADAIAKAYRCTLISFDDILDSISPSNASLVPPTRQEASRLADVAFNIVVRGIRLQLQSGSPVVVDSPLANPGHLDQLLQLAEEFKFCRSKSCDKLHCKRCSFVIVECRPETKYVWELRFRSRDFWATVRWYKPKEWSDVVFTDSVEHYPPRRLPDYVCRLIVDTTGYVDLPYLGIATLDLCICPKGHPIHFKDWNIASRVHPNFPLTAYLNKFTGRTIQHETGDHDQATNEDPCVDGRHLLEESTDEALVCSCVACQEPVPIDPLASYACKRCKIAMHKSCAELDKLKTMILPHQFPPFLRVISGPTVWDAEYRFQVPEEYRQRCGPCGVADREFSVNCKDCLWEMHWRSRLIPTLLRHEAHSLDHPLCFWITPKAQNYQCMTCKQPGCFAGYTCLKKTFVFNVHIECALFPRLLRHAHGEHNHHMRLTFSTPEVTDDYICDVCQGWRDPTACYYRCQECYYTSHLHCIYNDSHPGLVADLSSIGTGCLP